MIAKIYQRLFKLYGPQYWWPAKTRFQIIIGTILTQNTSWTNVEKAIHQLRKQACLTPQAIQAMPMQALASLIKSSGYYNQKAQRLKVFADWFIAQGGFTQLAKMPTAALRTALLNINGIGPETADSILLYAFKRPSFVIDAYTQRIFLRLGLLSRKEQYAVVQALFHAALPPDTQMFNEYHGLIVKHAKVSCRTTPLCSACGLRKQCTYAKTLNDVGPT